MERSDQRVRARDVMECWTGIAAAGGRGTACCTTSVLLGKSKRDWSRSSLSLLLL